MRVIDSGEYCPAHRVNTLYAEIGREIAEVFGP